MQVKGTDGVGGGKKNTSKPINNTKQKKEKEEEKTSVVKPSQRDELTALIEEDKAAAKAKQKLTGTWDDPDGDGRITALDAWTRARENGIEAGGPVLRKAARLDDWRGSKEQADKRAARTKEQEATRKATALVEGEDALRTAAGLNANSAKTFAADSDGTVSALDARRIARGEVGAKTLYHGDSVSFEKDKTQRIRDKSQKIRAEQEAEEKAAKEEASARKTGKSLINGLKSGLDQVRNAYEAVSNLEKNANADVWAPYLENGRIDFSKMTPEQTKAFALNWDSALAAQQVWAAQNKAEDLIRNPTGHTSEEYTKAWQDVEKATRAYQEKEGEYLDYVYPDGGAGKDIPLKERQLEGRAPKISGEKRWNLRIDREPDENKKKTLTAVKNSLAYITDLQESAEKMLNDGSFYSEDTWRQVMDALSEVDKGTYDLQETYLGRTGADESTRAYLEGVVSELKARNQRLYQEADRRRGNASLWNDENADRTRQALGESTRSDNVYTGMKGFADALDDAQLMNIANGNRTLYDELKNARAAAEGGDLDAIDEYIAELQTRLGRTETRDPNVPAYVPGNRTSKPSDKQIEEAGAIQAAIDMLGRLKWTAQQAILGKLTESDLELIDTYNNNHDAWKRLGGNPDLQRESMEREKNAADKLDARNNQIKARTGYDWSELANMRSAVLEHEDAEEYRAGAAEFALKSPAAAWLVARGANLIGGISSLAGMVDAALKPDVEFTQDSPYAVLQQFGNTVSSTQSGTIRDDVSSAFKRNGFSDGAANFMGGAAALGYSAMTSAVDSFIARSIGGDTEILGKMTATDALFGINAFTEAYTEAKANNSPTAQAMITSLGAGVFEALFEHVSLENMKAFRLVSPKKGKDFVRNAINSFVTEGSEELSTDLANTVWDIFVNGANSDYYQNVSLYMLAGNSAEDAKKKAGGDLALQYLESFVAGGLAGAGESSLVTAGAGAMYNLYTKTAMSNYVETGDIGASKKSDPALKAALKLDDPMHYEGENAQEIRDAAAGVMNRALDIGKAAAELGMKGGDVTELVEAAERVSKGEAPGITLKQARKDAIKVGSDVMSNADVQYRELLKSAFGEILTEQGAKPTRLLTGALADTVMNGEAAGWAAYAAETQAAKDALAEYDRVEKLAGNEETGEDELPRWFRTLLAGQALTQFRIGAVLGQSRLGVRQIDRSRLNVGEEGYTDPGGNFVQARTVGIAYTNGTGSAVVLMSDNKEVALQNVTFGSEDSAYIYKAAADLPITAAKGLIDNWNAAAGKGESSSAEEFANGYSRMFSMGVSGVPFETAAQASPYIVRALGESAARMAYEQGKNFTENPTSLFADMDEKYDGMVTFGEGDDAVVYDRNDAFYRNLKAGVNYAPDAKQLRLTPAQKIQLYVMNAVLGASGVKVVAHSSITAADGMMSNGFHDRANGVLHVALNAEGGLLLRTVAHEMAHQLKQTSPQAWGALRDYVVQTLKETPMKGVTAYDVKLEQLEGLYTFKENGKRYLRNGRAEEGSREYIDALEEEMVCDSCFGVLDDGERVKEFVKKNYRGAMKVRQVIDRLVKKINGALGRIAGVDASVAALRGQTEKLERIRELFFKAIAEADSEGGIRDAESQSGAESDGGIKYSAMTNQGGFTEDKYFRRQIDKIENLKPGAFIRIGELDESNPLVRVGMPAGAINFDVNKINKLLEDHSDYLSGPDFKLIPGIISNPVAISEYKEPGTISVFGYQGIKDKPTMVGVVISKNRGGYLIAKVRTFNIRSDAENLLTDGKILYLGENKKETVRWFQAFGIQVPCGGTTFGLIRKISYSAADVKSENAIKNSRMASQDAEFNKKLEEAGMAYDGETGTILHSRMYSTGQENAARVNRSKLVGMIADRLVKEGGMTREAAYARAESFVRAEEAAALSVRGTALDFTGSPLEVAIKKNSDYPQGTVDLTNICVKRLPITNLINNIQAALPDDLMTADDYSEIRLYMMADGRVVACGLCFVEDRRKLLGEITKDFLNEWDAAVRENRTLTRLNSEGKVKDVSVGKDLAARYGVKPGLVTPDPSVDLRQVDFGDSREWLKLQQEHPEIAAAFEAYNNARGQNSGRLLLGRAEYKREILKYSPDKVARINAEGGLRIFSFSDFEAIHLVDLIQIITDCAAVGLKIQGYTKQPDFAKLVRSTGMKLNRSLIPYGATGLKTVNGKKVLVFSSVEGMDITGEDFVDETDNPDVGNNLTGINDEQIQVAMLDDFVNYIIPFHSGKSNEANMQLGVGRWKNYKLYQTDKQAKNVKDIRAAAAAFRENLNKGMSRTDAWDAALQSTKAEFGALKEDKMVNIYTDVLTAEGVTDPRTFVEQYLKVCEERNIVPRFAQFLNVNENGDFEYNPGYEKLLLDFKLFDREGNVLPQKAVTANFDEGFIAELFKKELDKTDEERRGETYPQDMYDTLLNYIRAKHGYKDADMDAYNKAREVIRETQAKSNRDEDGLPGMTVTPSAFDAPKNVKTVKGGKYDLPSGLKLSRNYSAAQDRNALIEEYKKPITRADIVRLHSLILKRKSVNRFTPDEIRATGKWAYKYWQQMGAKSPFFRAWFGDWRAQDTAPIEIADIPDVDEDAFAKYIKDRRSEEGIENPDTTWLVATTSQGERNTKSHAGTEGLSVKALTGISDLIKKAVLLDSEVHEHHNNNAKSAETDPVVFNHRLYALGRTTDGMINLYRINVEDRMQDSKHPQKFLFHNLKHIEIVAEDISRRHFGKNRKRGVSTYNASTTKYNVADLYAFVKRFDSEFNVGAKVAPEMLNEDGTPRIVYHQTAADFTVFNTDNPVQGKYDSETPNGIFFKDNDHDIGIDGDKQMACYLSMRKPLHFANREEANKWYRKHIPGYARLADENKAAVEPVSKLMDDIEREMFGDVSEEEYENLEKQWDEQLEVLRGIEHDYGSRLRELLDDYFINNDSGYDGIILDYDGHRYVNGVRENVHTYIVFKNTQVKSATDNIGTFNRGESDIRLSRKSKSDNKFLKTEIQDAREKLEDATDSMALGVKTSYEPAAKRVAKAERSELMINYMSAAAQGVRRAEQAVREILDTDMALKDALREAQRQTKRSGEVGYRLTAEHVKKAAAELTEAHPEITATKKAFTEALSGLYGLMMNDTSMPGDEALVLASQVAKTATGDPWGETTVAQHELAQEILGKFVDIKYRQTFGDKADEKLQQYKVKANKRVASEREKGAIRFAAARKAYSDRLKEQKAADREKYEERLGKYKDYHKKKMHEKVEQHAKSKRVEQIRKHAEDLARKLKNPSEKKHIPANMVRTVIAALDLFSELDNTGHGERVSDALTHISDAYRESAEAGTAPANEELLEIIDNLKRTVGEKSIRELTVNELEALWKTIRAVEKYVREQNQAHSEMLNEPIDKMIGDLQREIGGKQAKPTRLKPDGKAGNAIERVKSLELRNLKPVYFFRRFGSDTMEKLFWAIQNSELGWERIAQEAQQVKWGADKAYDPRNRLWYERGTKDKTVTLELERGDRITLTATQAASLWLMSRDEGGANHLMAGGFIIKKPEYKKGADGKYHPEVSSRNIRMTAQDFVSLGNALTEDQKAYALRMQKYLAGPLAAHGNAVTQKLYELDRFTNETYWPLKSAQEFLDSDPNNPNRADTVSVRSPGFTKYRIPNASNPVVLEDMFTVWARHVNGMALYASMTLPLDDMLKVWNTRSYAGANVDAQSVQMEIRSRFGDEYVRYMEQFLRDINGGLRGDPSATFLNSLLSRFKAAAVMGNVSVALQQPASVGRAMAYIKPQYLVVGAAKTNAHYNRSREELLEHAAIAGLKARGAFDVMISTGLNESLTERDDLRGRSAREWANTVLGYGAEFGDNYTWTVMWEACKTQVKTQEGLTGERLLNKAAELFNKTMVMTQVYDSVFSRSELMRAKDTGVKEATAFMAEPTTSLNMIEDMIYQIRSKRMSKGDAARVFAGVMTSIILANAASSLIGAIRKKDEEQNFWEKFLASFGSGVGEDLLPITYIPIVKDIFSVFQGYDMERSSFSGIKNLYDTLTKVMNPDKRSPETLMLLIGAVADLTGLPGSRLTKDVFAAARFADYLFDPEKPKFSGAGVKEAFKAEWTNTLTKNIGKSLEAARTAKLYRDYVNGSDTYEKRYDMYLDEGYTEDEIEKSLRTYYANQDKRTQQAKKLAEDGDITGYKALVEEMAADTGLSKSFIADAVLGYGKHIGDSIYTANMVVTAFNAGSPDSAEILEAVIEARAQVYMSQGKDAETALKDSMSAMRTAFTSFFKTPYQDALKAGNTDEAERIRQIVVGSGVYADAEKAVANWAKEVSN
jgi:hypothetical protein